MESLREIIDRHIVGPERDRAEGILALLGRELYTPSPTTAEPPAASHGAGGRQSPGIELARPENAFTNLPKGSERFQEAVARLNKLIRSDGTWRFAADQAYQAALLWPIRNELDARRRIEMLAASVAGEAWHAVEDTAGPSPEWKATAWLLRSPNDRAALLARVPLEVRRAAREMADPLTLLLWLYSGARKRADGYLHALLAMGDVGSWTIEDPAPPPPPPGLQGLVSSATRSLPLYPLTDPVARQLAAHLANEPDPLERLRVCSDPRCTWDEPPHECVRRGTPGPGGPFYVDQAHRHRAQASVACCNTHLAWVRSHDWEDWVHPSQ